MPGSNSNIRVRLLFDDCTPSRPGSVGRRKCWFLLNADSCRRVTDVEYCIRETFCLGRSTQIELLLDDFVLPPFERSEIIQQNDLIKVKLLGGTLGEDELSDDEVYTRNVFHSSKKKKKRAEKDQQTAKPVSGNRRPDGTDTRLKEKLGKKSKKRASSASVEERSNGGGSKKKIKEQLNNKVGNNSLSESSTLRSEKSGKDVKSKISSQASGKRTEQVAKNSEPANIAKGGKLSGNKPTESSSSSSSTSSSGSDAEEESQSQPQVKSQVITKGKSTLGATKAVGGKKPSLPNGTSTTIAKKVNPKGASKLQKTPQNGAPESESSESEDSEPDSSDSESSSTDEDAVNKKGNVSGQQRMKQGTSLSPKVASSKFVQSGAKKSGTGKPETPTHSAKQTKSRDNSLQTKKITVSESKAPSSSSASPNNVQLSRNGANTPAVSFPSTTVRTSSVKPSRGKSSGGHVRFSSDSDSSPETDLNVEVRDLAAVEKGNPPASIGAKLSFMALHSAQTLQRDSQMAGSVPKETRGIDENCSTPAEGQMPTEAVKDKIDKVVREPPKPKDYSSFPPLVGPPRVGDVIAYKVLELSSDYTPEVSAYKEGEVVNFNHSTSMVEVRLSQTSMALEPSRDGGRFELEAGDETTPVANNVPLSTIVLVTLPSLIEPKLVT